MSPERTDRPVSDHPVLVLERPSTDDLIDAILRAEGEIAVTVEYSGDRWACLGWDPSLVVRCARDSELFVPREMAANMVEGFRFYTGASWEDRVRVRIEPMRP